MKNVVCFTLALAFVGCGGAPPPEDHASGHPGAAGHHGHGAHQHDFSDVKRFAPMFDDPARDEWQRPDEVARLLEITPGMTVVDLGAGTGYFLPYLARAVGPDGHVLALDTEPAMVHHMEQRITEAGMSNAEARAVSPDDPGLAPESVDRVLVVDTWHHIADRERYAARLSGALRPGGFVLVVDFTRESPHGPPPEMRLSADAVVSELSAGGLDASVVEEDLPYQYVVRAARR